MKVTSLADSGPGTLREAIKAWPEPITFAVGGHRNTAWALFLAQLYALKFKMMAAWYVPPVMPQP